MLQSYDDIRNFLLYCFLWNKKRKTSHSKLSSWHCINLFLDLIQKLHRFSEYILFNQHFWMFWLRSSRVNLGKKLSLQILLLKSTVIQLFLLIVLDLYISYSLTVFTLRIDYQGWKLLPTGRHIKLYIWSESVFNTPLAWSLEHSLLRP